MTNEQRTAKKRKPAGPGSLSPRARKEMTGHEEDPERLTKSGRLNLEQVKDAIAESDKDD